MNDKHNNHAVAAVKLHTPKKSIVSPQVHRQVRTRKARSVKRVRTARWIHKRKWKSQKKNLNGTAGLQYARARVSDKTAARTIERFQDFRTST